MLKDYPSYKQQLLQQLESVEPQVPSIEPGTFFLQSSVLTFSYVSSSVLVILCNSTHSVLVYKIQKNRNNKTDEEIEIDVVISIYIPAFRRNIWVVTLSGL